MGNHGRLGCLVSRAFPTLGRLNPAGRSADNVPREAVSGSVSIDGNPLKSGAITFVPNGPDIPSQGGTPVVDGKYSIPRAQGLVPGKYKVVISSGEGTPEKKVDTATDM